MKKCEILAKLREEHFVIRFDPSDEEEEHFDFVVSSVRSKRRMTKTSVETTSK